MTDGDAWTGGREPVGRGRSGVRAVLGRAWAELAADALDALWPPACAICGGAAVPSLRTGSACAEHALPARPAGPRCGRCAERLSDALPDGATCARCRRAPPAFRAVVALGDYRADAGLREWILAFKHGGRRGLGRELGRALAARWAETGLGAGALVAAVPLHPLRLLERGFDQARVLADAVAEVAGAEVVPCLRRARWTPPQGEPGARSRGANVRDAFRLRRRGRGLFAGRDVALVDDVVTSGATASACARALRAGGARSVHVLCLARVGEQDGGGGARMEDAGGPPRAPPG